MILKLIRVVSDKVGKSSTLSDTAPDADLLLWCRSCHHHVTVPIASAIALYGAARTVPSIKARCGDCGSRDVDVRPDWRPKAPPVTRHS